MTELLLVALTRLSLVVATGTVLVSFSLLAYLFVYNFRDPVARAFVLLLGFASVVYVGDVFLATARLPASHPAAGFWLRFEWLGIAFVVPAFLHFGDALLLTTGDRSRARRWLLVVAYILGAAAWLAAIGGTHLVGGVVGEPGSVHLTPGSLFAPFALAYAAGAVWGTRCVWLARKRTLTSRSRRRMSYLLVSAIAPVSVFPYLVLGGARVVDSPAVFLAIASVANLATATMLVVVAYAVAYHGALMPDRTVKRELIKYLVQAPTLGLFVIATVQLVPARLEASLGLPRDVVFALAVVVGIVTYQFVVRALRPVIDRLVYGSESDEVMWLRRIDERLLTERDLAQLLENILAAMCDRLRVRDGFIVVMSRGGLTVDAHAGSRERALQVIDRLDPGVLAEIATEPSTREVDGFWVRALRPTGAGAALGLLAIAQPDRELTGDEKQAYRSLVGSTERALEDRLVQQRVIGALRELAPEIEGIQRLRGALERGHEDAITTVEASPVYDPDFPHWVKDALSHYWGGPKLSDSPLLGLAVVRDALEANDYNAAKAMRAVLDQALDQMKPEGERSLTASQWLVYNILELRFVRGIKVRDLAARLAMSESDLYRKQRLAIDALAQQLAAMETGPTANHRDRTVDEGTAPSGHAPRAGKSSAGNRSE